MGWNGKRTSIPAVKEFTFWGRKRAADRVSQSAAVTRLLSAIDSVRQQRNDARDLTVHVGHSLGARILYTAVAQGLVRQTELAHPGPLGGYYKPIRGFGDIVILLNPAFEASLFTTFDSVRRKEYPFASGQAPVLVSISSATDWATRVAFPIGQALTFNARPKRRVTLGNFQPYRTHMLLSREKVQSPTPSTWCSPNVCMVPIDGLEPDVPFVSAQAEGEVMDGHSDVWNPNLRNFLVHMIVQIASGEWSRVEQVLK